ncbi:MAG: transposase [bacterium]|nr:transposase [bacterium]
MPRNTIVLGEYYHIYNRGVNKQIIFQKTYDYARMLFFTIFAQSPLALFNISPHIESFLKNGNFNVSDSLTDKLLRERNVELNSFTLMPNHFHLELREIKEGGIAGYLQRLEISHTKFFNIKYGRSGYLFQGPFQSVHIKTNEQALYLSAYIHRNPRELASWKNKEDAYPWSSYQDYVKRNRWGVFLNPEITLEQFSTPAEYRDFVETSGAKEKKIIPDEFLIDSF